MHSRSIKILIAVVALNTIALFSYYLIFQQIKSQTQSASALISTIELGQKKTGILNSLRNVTKETDAKRSKLATFMLSGDSEIAFIEQIENLAKQSGVVANTKNVSSIPADTNKTKFFQMQIDTNGTWTDTMYFLNQLENMPYNVRVQEISFNKQSGKNWSASFSFSVSENL